MSNPSVWKIVSRQQLKALRVTKLMGIGVY